MTTPLRPVPDVSLCGFEEQADILVLENRNHWELYPTEDPLSIDRLERTPDGIGLIVTVATTFDFGRLEVAGEGHATVSVTGPVITLRFDEADRVDRAGHELTITAVAATGERTAPHSFKVMFASRARDLAKGRTSTRNRITIRDTDLKLRYSRVADWIVDNPTAEDRAYARNRWGGLIRNTCTPYARARAVTRAVIDDFEPQRGTPSDAMTRLHPFRQHERILAKIDHGWCANIAEVLSLALNSLDVPCRLVRMRHTYYNADSDAPGRDFEVLLAGGHTIAEIFDVTLNQWIWIDPSQRQLGARDGAGHWLSLAEIHHRLNLPHQARDLRLDAYDPATQRETTHAFADSPVRANMLHYGKREQRFYYFKRREAAAPA